MSMISYIKQSCKFLMIMPCVIAASLLLSGCNNGDPVSAGAILITSTVAPINTVYESGGTIIVTNVGNRNAESLTISNDNQVLSNITGCTGETLAPAESCTITFNVPESSGVATLIIGYGGASTPSIPTIVYITWYNSRGDHALTTMSAESNPLLFAVNQTGATTITVKNIGGYTLRNISIPDPIVLGGSGVATISNNHCAESVSLPIESACTYQINITDNVVESGQQVYLGFSGYYQGPESSNARYNRSLLLGYSSQ